MNFRNSFPYVSILLIALISITLLSSFHVADARRRGPSSCRELGTCRTQSWDLMPHYSRDIFDHMFKVPIPFNTLFEQHQRQLANLQKSVPHYEISDSVDKMELSFDLPGVRLEDIVVELRDGGKLLKIYGSRKYSRNGTVFKSDFEESFTIDDRSLDVNSISASLSDGVLVVSAPKLKQNLPMVEKRIPIHIPSDTSDKIEGLHGENIVEQNEPITSAESEGIEVGEEEEIDIEKE